MLCKMLDGYLADTLEFEDRMEFMCHARACRRCLQLLVDHSKIKNAHLYRFPVKKGKGQNNDGERTRITA